MAQGLARNEILYAMHHLNNYVKEVLLRMLEWEAGLRTGFKVSVGKHHKYLDQYIPIGQWRKLLSTYNTMEIEECWNALFAACDLFREVARYVGHELKYTYPEKDDTRVTSYLKSVREAGPTAKLPLV